MTRTGSSVLRRNGNPEHALAVVAVDAVLGKALAEDPPVAFHEQHRAAPVDRHSSRHTRVIRPASADRRDANRRVSAL
jgi:hypothetical protein